ncbi:MAG: TlpA family protein disulfide reductase [Candidatus Methylumidiphilus sp.]
MKKISLLLLLLAGSPLALAVQEGAPPPDCPAQRPGNAGKLDLSAYKGQVVLIDFWATWCPPCKKSMPFLNSLRNQHHKAGFEIVAINVDENPEDAAAFLKTAPVDYPMAFDASGECPRLFDVKAMPSSYLLDRKGNVRLVHLGFRDEDQDLIRKHVETLLAE